MHGLRACPAALLFAAFVSASPAAAIDLGLRGFQQESKILASSNPAGFGQAGAAQPVPADLFLPNAPGPHAAVIVVPGSDGLSAAKEGAYAGRLLQAGLAVLVIDPLRVRKLDNLLQDPAALSDAAMVEDVRAALALLAKDGRIDAGRIGALGTSRGATVLMAAAGLRSGAIRALALPYPFCAHDWRLGRGPRAPQVLMLLAGREDEVSNDACMDLARIYVADDIALTLEVLPGAYHGFDAGMPGAAVPVDSVRDCPLVPVQDDGSFRTGVIPGAPATAATTAELVQAMRGCVTTGAHWGETPGSRERALARVTSFLADALIRGDSPRPTGPAAE
jgi:dienelactone hydrolase